MGEVRESGVLLKEKETLKEKRIPLILLAKGNIPKDYPKDKLLEYYNLKFNLELGKEVNKSEFEMLNEEIKRWQRNENNDPSYFMLLNLAEKINLTGKYLAEIAFEEFCYPDISEAILSLALRGYKFIIVIPIDYLSGISQETFNKIEELKSKLNVEIVVAWPYSLTLLLDFIREHLYTFMGR
jgi:hypothetical protein